jgi:hypothetical protein
MEKIVEYRWTECYRIGPDEYETVPFRQRIRYKKFLFMWVPVQAQLIRMVMNDYIKICAFGADFIYPWHHKLDADNVKIKRRNSFVLL